MTEPITEVLEAALIDVDGVPHICMLKKVTVGHVLLYHGTITNTETGAHTPIDDCGAERFVCTMEETARRWWKNTTKLEALS